MHRHGEGRTANTIHLPERYMIAVPPFLTPSGDMLLNEDNVRVHCYCVPKRYPLHSYIPRSVDRDARIDLMTIDPHILCLNELTGKPKVETMFEKIATWSKRMPDSFQLLNEEQRRHTIFCLFAQVWELLAIVDRGVDTNDKYILSCELLYGNLLQEMIAHKYVTHINIYK